MDNVFERQKTISPNSFKRFGEWLELKLPESWAQMQVAACLEKLPIPEKLVRKLLSASDDVRRKGERLQLRLFPGEPIDFTPDYTHEIDILFEDDFCLVAAKPAGMPVHPNAPGQSGSLANAVAAHYEMTGQNCRIRHIHRLDNDTTGPVLYAKNELAQLTLDAAMREKRITREYAAIVEGRMTSLRGTVSQPIGRDRHNPKKRRVSPSGDHAVTHFTTETRSASHSLVRLRLETGRTHQIRVHMAAIGHPLAGDSLYGGHVELIARQALHGERLLFDHPWIGEPVDVTAPWPPDMMRLKRLLFTDG